MYKHKKREEKMKKKNFALFIVILSILFFAFSIMFIAENSNHECAGTNCEICEEIAICQNILNMFGLGLFCACIICIKRHKEVIELNNIKFKSFIRKDSLITLKVELLA